MRHENQDRIGHTVTPSGLLYVLADGMGGHKGGATAAKMTVHGLSNYIATTADVTDTEKIIGDAFRHTNTAVYERAHCGDTAIEGMGSTAVVLLIQEDIGRIAHVGDSRAYLFRNNRLQQLTRDHTLVQRMVDAGMLSPEEAANHPDSNILDRAIGNKPEIDIDIEDGFALLDGDAILLCSDGLSGYVSNTEIESILQHHTNAQEIPGKLIQFALDVKASEDNITVQFIQYGRRKHRASGEKLNARLLDIFKKKTTLAALVICLIIAATISAWMIFHVNKDTDHNGKNISPIDKQENIINGNTKATGKRPSNT